MIIQICWIVQLIWKEAKGTCGDMSLWWLWASWKAGLICTAGLTATAGVIPADPVCPSSTNCWGCWEVKRFPAWCPWTPPEGWVEQDAPESAIVCFLKMHQSWKSTWALSSLWGSWSSSLWKSSWWCLPSAVSCTASPQWRCLCQSSCRDQGLARTQFRKWPWSGVGLNRSKLRVRDISKDGSGVVHCCTMSLCYLGAKTQISIQRSSSWATN